MGQTTSATNVLLHVVHLMVVCYLLFDPNVTRLCYKLIELEWYALLNIMSRQFTATYKDTALHRAIRLERNNSVQCDYNITGIYYVRLQCMWATRGVIH